MLADTMSGSNPRSLQRVPSTNDSWDFVSAPFPETQPQPVAHANRGRTRTRLHRTTSQLYPHDQESDAARAGLSRSDSAPSVRANSGKRRARGPKRSRGRSQRSIVRVLFSKGIFLTVPEPLDYTMQKITLKVVTTESVRVLKGGFVIKTPSTEHYKYPSARSQPEPVWRAGDGFSDDEAATDFLFYATGTRKRKRSSTLPRMGKLHTGVDETESRSIRPSNKRSRGIGIYENLELLRGEQKEAWPTKSDFEDCTLRTRRARELTILDHDDADTIIPATFRPQRERSIDSRSTVKFVPRSNKGALDFANFRHSVVVKSTFPEDNLLSQIRISRDHSVSGEDEEDAFYEEDEEPIPEDGSQVDGDREDYATSYVSTRASSPSGAYWDEHGNHVFPEDEVYDEYGDDMDEQGGMK
ncbi:hypothetical protein PG985_004579 [Apiospora marii]|uniref:Transcription factor Iwr1 domain-containing protein n=1 Tax=Apiospora marii TaxID=335849 RepID=A0ABR1S9R9_9PEZI